MSPHLLLALCEAMPLTSITWDKPVDYAPAAMSLLQHDEAAGAASSVEMANATTNSTTRESGSDPHEGARGLSRDR